MPSPPISIDLFFTAPASESSNKDNIDPCSICLDPFSPRELVSCTSCCAFITHAQCLAGWAKEKGVACTCPKCRRRMNGERILAGVRGAAAAVTNTAELADEDSEDRDGVKTVDVTPWPSFAIPSFYPREYNAGAAWERLAFLQRRAYMRRASDDDDDDDDNDHFVNADFTRFLQSFERDERARRTAFAQSIAAAEEYLAQTMEAHHERIEAQSDIVAAARGGRWVVEFGNNGELLAHTDETPQPEVGGGEVAGEDVRAIATGDIAEAVTHQQTETSGAQDGRLVNELTSNPGAATSAAPTTSSSTVAPTTPPRPTGARARLAAMNSIR